MLFYKQINRLRRLAFKPHTFLSLNLLYYVSFVFFVALTLTTSHNVALLYTAPHVYSLFAHFVKELRAFLFLPHDLHIVNRCYGFLYLYYTIANFQKSTSWKLSGDSSIASYASINHVR